ncbi:MAG: hypothetical protein QOI24_1415 [Acidobacteriota bacterium]|nr:hypothetical protein [Acidobacteriota bacterium]
MEVRRGVRSASEPDIAVTLQTDSEHLATFFAANWTPPQGLSENVIATRIVALRHPPFRYGLDGVVPARWFDADQRTMYIVGSEYYGNVKISVRGLASAVVPPSQMFAHGCSMDVEGRGILICGNSGAGKTTITRRLRELFSASVVNDDWGSLSLVTGEAVYTGEGHLHMKYQSVSALAPGLPLSPAVYLTENLSDSGVDGHARLLIARDVVFGGERVANRTTIAGIVFLMRTATGVARIRKLSSGDLHVLEQGAYSAFYGRTEHFMNGSLILTDDHAVEMHRALHRRLLDRFPCVLVENGGSPDDATDLILRMLR